MREAAFMRPSIREGVSCWRNVVFSDNHKPVPTPRITFEPIATQAFEVTAITTVATAHSHIEMTMVVVVPLESTRRWMKNRLSTVPRAAPTERAVKVTLSPPRMSSL